MWAKIGLLGGGTFLHFCVFPTCVVSRTLASLFHER